MKIVGILVIAAIVSFGLYELYKYEKNKQKPTVYEDNVDNYTYTQAQDRKIIPLPDSYQKPKTKYLGYSPLENISLSNQKGCKAFDAVNYDPNPLSTPQYDGCMRRIYGCTNPKANNYNKDANTDYKGACWFQPPKYGCTEHYAFNYDPRAQVNDGSCVAKKYGCTDPLAVNFDMNANIDDGMCSPFVLGCTKRGSKNYNDYATVDDGSCEIGGKTVCGVGGTPSKSKTCSFCSD